MPISNNKKIFCGLSLILFSLVAFLPQPAQADPGEALEVTQQKNTFESSLTTGLATWEKEYKILTEMGSALAANFAERILNKITGDIVDWIKGVDDEPKFISDFGEFLTETVDDVAGEFISEQLGLGLLCEPFKPFLQLAFSQPPFQERARCSLSDIGANLENFSQDFNQGGWEAWVHLIENPQNTVHGAYLISAAELRKIKEREAKAQEIKTLVSGGYKPLECTDAKIAEGLCTADQKGQVLTPGSMLLNMATTALNVPIEQRSLELALWKSKIPLSPYISSILDAMIWRLTKETFASLGDTDISSSEGGYSLDDPGSWPTLNPGVSPGIPEADKNLAGDLSNLDRITAVVQSLRNAAGGFISQQAGKVPAALTTLRQTQENNLTLAKSIQLLVDTDTPSFIPGLGDNCQAPDPSVAAVQQKLNEANTHLQNLQNLFSGGEAGVLGKISEGQKALLNYEKNMEFFLNSFSLLTSGGSASLLDETGNKTGEPKNIEEWRAALGEKREETIKKLAQGASLGLEYFQGKYKDQKDGTGAIVRSAFDILTDDINAQSSALNRAPLSGLPEQERLLLSMIELTPEQIENWQKEADQNKTKLQQQRTLCEDGNSIF